jgi:hypothetical protein
MNEDTPDPFELIRREAVPSEPSDEDYRRARQRLEAAILQENRRRERQVPRWIVPAIASLLLVLVVGGVSLFRPSQAEAALAEIAEAARQAKHSDIPEGSFIYSRSERLDLAIRPGIEFGLDEEFVGYLIPSSREVWRQPDNEFIQIRAINHTPIFLDPDLEDLYYQLDLDKTDQLGETQLEKLTGVADPLLEEDWPTQPNALHEALREHVSQSGDERPEAAQIFDLATDLLREANPSPELRAALVEVLAALPVELIEQTGETITIAITYTSPTHTRDSITLDHDGVLLAEESTLLEDDPQLGIPADTTILKVIYQETHVTDDL